MKRLLTALLILPILLSSCVALPPSPTDQPLPFPAQGHAINLDETMPLDPAVRTGVLDNGLTYYIRQNDQPAQRAEVWLAINAGSLQEEDDQRGLAHFIEHMLFNGTRSFKGTELVAFLESLGMEFGPDVNAYTSFDETVYTLEIPTDDPAKLETALKVLEEWAAYATLTPEEIDKERGVIIEEWRLGEENAGGRINDQIVPLIFGDSRYAARLPIGDPEIIKHAPPEALRRFYQTWYRPDLMSVIAVGDFADVDAVEAHIRARFGALPAKAEPSAERIAYDLPPQEGTASLIVTDPEVPYTALEVFYTEPTKPLKTVGDYRELLAGSFATAILGERLEDLRRTANAPYLSASVTRAPFLRPVDAISVFVQVEEGKVLEGLDAVTTEIERARRYGFTETELQRVRDQLLRYYESAYTGRANRESAPLAQEYLSLFLEGIASPGIEYEYDLVQQLLPTITLDEINERVKTLASGEDRAVVLVAPEKTRASLPTEAELTNTMDVVAAKEIAPYEDHAAGLTLMDEKLAPVAITSEWVIPELGVTDLTLANGVRILLKPTDFQDDEIVISATSPGGNSLVSDEDYPEASTIENVINQSGVGNLSQIELEKLLSNKLVSAWPYIGEMDEGFGAYASPQDVEIAFQLIYLYATQPRTDPAALEVMQTQMKNDLKNRDLVPESALYDVITEIFCGTGVRCTDPTAEEIDGLDMARGLAIYKDRFADMSDFTFTIVGNFDMDAMKDLTQRYLGNLPASDRVETWRDVSSPLPRGVIEREIHKGIGDQGQSILAFTGPFDPSLKNQARLDALEAILSIRVRDELRETLGGTYSPSVSTSWQRLPRPEYTVSVSVASDPKRADELAAATFRVIEKLKTEGPTAAEVATAKEQERLDYEEQLAQNGFWTFALEDAFTSRGGNPDDILKWKDAVAALTVEDVRAAAREYLPVNRYVHVTLRPE